MSSKYYNEHYYKGHRCERLQYSKKYKQEHKEETQRYNEKYQKSYREENREELRISNKKLYQKNKKERLEKQKKYNQEHKEEIRKYKQEHKEEIMKWQKEYSRTYYLSHKKEIRQWRKKYEKQYVQRYYVKIKINIRSRISDALRKHLISKQHHTIEYLGCSWEFYKDYIEKQFTEGMTWENYGLYGWHIDHIKSLYTFDLTKDEECFKAFHYSNTRPLWCTDNWQRSKI